MDTMTPNAFPITVKATWTEADAIPPGCRKPRDVDHDIEVPVSVPMISSEDFPLAITSTCWDGTKAYHLYDGNLYAPYLPNSRQTEMFRAGSGDFSTIRHNYGRLRYRTLDEANDAVARNYTGLLIVDGNVWTRDTSEPFYEVSLGNEGWNRTSPRVSVTTYGNQAEYTHFNALEREEAVAYALSATDEEHRPGLLVKLEADESTIEVHLPEAVQLKFNRLRSKGETQVNNFANKVNRDFEAAMGHAQELVDPEAIARGEITYRDYMAAALKYLLDVEEPRQREHEANRGW
jgi:hypothetical protein